MQGGFGSFPLKLLLLSFLSCLSIRFECIGQLGVSSESEDADIHVHIVLYVPHFSDALQVFSVLFDFFPFQ